jgi:uncharacterized membrane protein YidH (DUF202 family)
MAKLLGIVLVVVGLTLAGVTILRLDRDDAARRTGAAAPVAAEASTGALTEVALPLVAALTFATGIVLLVVGVGRWNHPRRHAAPGDAVVDPEAHHKMDHV